MSTLYQNTAALVVAGGIGARMGAAIPKQYLELAGKPILLHTLEKFSRFEKKVLVLPEAWLHVWLGWQQNRPDLMDWQYALGGETRSHSVQNGLRLLDDKSYWVAVHDAVRPFVSDSLLLACLACAKENGNAIPVVPMKDSLRCLTNGSLSGESQSVDRSLYRAVQTPQVLNSQELDALLSSFIDKGFPLTDESSLLDLAGKKVHLVDGEYTNLKITTPEDMLWAEAFFVSSQNKK